ncbi:MAG: sulfate adenylyltransferase [Alphaproteobacteria bacterium]|nr:sulfate adenylyltransferase [Alphaproteobacteria bacterium]|tara:strand:- start:676 stop:1947 length:1272 start_codon:yes stop_codon:yes gene_type:complete
MSQLVNPHGGGPLKPLLVPESERADGISRAKSLKQIPISSREVSDLLMLAMGAYTPLDGFMGHDDWRGACVDMKLADGTFWPIPITLSCDKTLGDSIADGEEVALVDADTGEVLGALTVTEKYTIDRELECQSVFRTTDPEHPGVQKVMAQPEVNLAGPVVAFSESHYPETYKGLYFRPDETRKMFEEKGWSRVAAFQTRNPMHRSHEFLAKIAVEVCDGVLIHQVLGALKPGDIPANVRVASIDKLVENYFAPGTAIQAGYPIEMRYAGPREALLHALFRQNFGCSHLVVGRDHAGVGDYYGPFDAHDIFDELDTGSLETQPLKIDITFFCHQCGGMATDQTPCFPIGRDGAPVSEAERIRVAAKIATGAEKPCTQQHPDEAKLAISGTRLREMFANHETVPEEFSRREVLEVLQAYYDTLK